MSNCNQIGSNPNDQIGDLNRRRVVGLGATALALGAASKLFGASVSHAQDSNILGHSIVGQGAQKVIVLHDWSVSSKNDYEFIQPFLDENSLSFAFADVRGYGLSAEMSGDYSSDEITADVEALANHLGWDQFAIVGHSMTGMAVQKVMSRLSNRVQRVVATVPVPASGVQPDADTLAFYESVATDDAAFKAIIHALTGERYGDTWANYKLEQNRNSVRPEAMKAYASMFSKENFSSEVKGNKTPILVIYGQYDSEGLRIEALGPIFEEWFENYSSHVMPTGHYPMIEAPVEYAKVVQDFILET